MIPAALAPTPSKHRITGSTMAPSAGACQPGIIATALFRRISEEKNLPVVNLFYDGAAGQNQRLEVYLRAAMQARAEQEQRA